MPITYKNCAAVNCNNCVSENSTVKYFMFPKNETSCLMWLTKLQNSRLNGLPFKKIRQNYSVCEKHFEDSNFQTPEKQKLNRNAVPTLFSEVYFVPLSEHNIDSSILSTHATPTLFSDLLPTTTKQTSSPTELLPEIINVKEVISNNVCKVIIRTNLFFNNYY